MRGHPSESSSFTGGFGSRPNSAGPYDPPPGARPSKLPLKGTLWTSDQVHSLDLFIRKRHPSLTEPEVSALRRKIIGDGAPRGNEAALQSPGAAGTSFAEPAASRTRDLLDEENRSLRKRVTGLEEDLLRLRANSGLMEEALQREKKDTMARAALLEEDAKRLAARAMEKDQKYQGHVQELTAEIKSLRLEAIKRDKGGSDRNELMSELTSLRKQLDEQVADYDGRIRELAAVNEHSDRANRTLKNKNAEAASRLQAAFERIEKLSQQIQKQKDRFNKDAISHLDEQLREERDTLKQSNRALSDELSRLRAVLEEQRITSTATIQALEREASEYKLTDTRSDCELTVVKESLYDLRTVINRHFPYLEKISPQKHPSVLDAFLQKLKTQLETTPTPPMANQENVGERKELEERLRNKAAELEEVTAFAKKQEIDIKSLHSTIKLLSLQQDGPKMIAGNEMVAECSTCLANRPDLASIPQLEEELNQLKKMGRDVDFERERVRLAHDLNQGLSSEIDTLTLDLGTLREEHELKINVLKEQMGRNETQADSESIRQVYLSQLKTLRQVVASILGWEINIAEDSDDEGNDEELWHIQLRSIYIEPNDEGEIALTKMTKPWMESILLGEFPPPHCPAPELSLTGTYKDRYHGDNETGSLLRDYKVGSSNDWYPHFLSLINIDDYKRRISRKGII